MGAMRAWAVVVLCFFGLLSNQMAAADWKKIYYAELTVEEGAVLNVSDLLQNLRYLEVGTLNISDFIITTECDILGNKTICNCTTDHIWSGDVCDSLPECCNKEKCTLNRTNPTPMCLPKSQVKVTGSMFINHLYPTALEDPTSDTYIKWSANISKELIAAYSTFSGFVSLSITAFRPGSIIVDFTMSFNSLMDPQQLSEKTSMLATSLNQTFKLATSGVVKIQAPQGPLCYMAQNISLNCTLNGNFEACNWTLSTEDSTTLIVNGTGVTVAPNCSVLTLKEATELWRGTYTCSFSTGSILHIASADLDIVLLPVNIEILSEPQYPDCTNDLDTKQVKITCAIQTSTENYSVTWEVKGALKGLERNSTKGNLIVFDVTISLVCVSAEDPEVCCKFTNRLDQSKSGHITIPTIFRNTTVCEQDGNWPKAKTETTATLPCENDQVGRKERNCVKSGLWMTEQSPCVNQALHDILQDVLNIKKGLGSVEQLAPGVFERLQKSTNNSNSINTLANVNASVNILYNMNNISSSPSSESIFPDSILPDLLESASNLLNPTLEQSWNSIPNPNNRSDKSLSVQFLMAIEGLVTSTNINGSTANKEYENVEFKSCQNQSQGCEKVFNVTITMTKNTEGIANILGFKSLAPILPNSFTTDADINSIVISIQNKNDPKNVKINFPLFKERPRNHQIFCVFWSYSLNMWSEDGCSWKMDSLENQTVCECSHLTSFSALMAKHPIELKFLDELTYVGLGVSICSLIVCLIIECLVWNSVVKSNVSHFRHTALTNISLCLLLADTSFLIDSFLKDANRDKWCIVFVIMKHFCFLSMFFWMLCLSVMLLHQLIFVFHQLRKKVYMVLSVLLGYACPLIIVAVTYFIYDNGKVDSYYNKKTCWLNYDGFLKGSIHAFIFPVGTIVLINLFSMMVVIVKLLRPSMSEGNTFDEKQAAKSILKAVVFLTPIFGVTWILGFFVLAIDLTTGFLGTFVNYAFTLVNAFQGLLILLTGCFGDKKVRDALLKYVTVAPTKPFVNQSKSDSSTKQTSSIVKK